MVTTSGPPHSGSGQSKGRFARLLERLEPRLDTASAARFRVTVSDLERVRKSLQGIRKPAWNLVLVLMMGLTCWAVSTVSIWLVPAYLGIMVLLLGSPQQSGGDSASSSKKSGSERETKSAKRAARGSSGAEAKASDQGSLADSDRRADVSDGPTAGTAKSGSRAGKPRSARGRSRKSTAKGGSDPANPPAPATWIRIGPGKFVRADAHPDADALTDAAAVADTVAGVDDSTTVEIGPVDSGAGLSSVESIEPETAPEPELESGCHGIAPSALDSLLPEEPVPPLIQNEADLVSPPVSLEEDGNGAQLAAVDVVLPDSGEQPGSEALVSPEPELPSDAEPAALVCEDPDVVAVRECVANDPDADRTSDPDLGLADDPVTEPIESIDDCVGPSLESEPEPDENAEPEADTAWEEAEEPDIETADAESDMDQALETYDEAEEPESLTPEPESDVEEVLEVWDEAQESDVPTAEAESDAEGDLETWDEVEESEVLDPNAEYDTDRALELWDEAEESEVLESEAEFDEEVDLEAQDDEVAVTSASGDEFRGAVSPRHRLRGAIRGQVSARIKGRSRDRNSGSLSVDRSIAPRNRQRPASGRVGAWRSRVDRSHRPRSPPYRSFPKSNRVD